MALDLKKSDLLSEYYDAVVCPTDEFFSGKASLDGEIHRAAGPELRLYCNDLPSLRPGNAVSSPGFNLKNKYIIHTSGPVYIDGKSGEEEILRRAYRNCLDKAEELGCESVAFPLISTGTFGYPKIAGLTVACSEIQAWLVERDSELSVTVVVRDIEDHSGGSDKYPGLKKQLLRLRNEIGMAAEDKWDLRPYDRHPASKLLNEAESINAMSLEPSESAPKKKLTLADMIDERDASFMEMVEQLRTMKGIKTSDLYHNANLTKSTYSKLLLGTVKPTKQTACALTLALELSMEEADNLLEKAGYVLSNSINFDIIIRYFIKHRKYNVIEINEILYDYDQPTLGAKMD